MTESTPQSRGGRFPAILLAGCVLGIPVGWLLATLGALPFFLGLFFCLLFCLLVGATMYRFGRSARPLPVTGLWAAGLVVSLVVWGTSLFAEYCNVRGYNLYTYRDDGIKPYPITGDAQKVVRRSYAYRTLSTEEATQLREGVQKGFAEQLEAKYPPGGFLGFVRWATTRQELQLPRVLSDTKESFRLRDQGPKWTIRIVLSLIFISGAILSQVLGLAQLPGSQNEDSGDPHQKDQPPSV